MDVILGRINNGVRWRSSRSVSRSFPDGRSLKAVIEEQPEAWLGDEHGTVQRRGSPPGVCAVRRPARDRVLRMIITAVPHR